MNNNFTPNEIKKLRKTLNLTQVQFSRKLKIDAVTVSRWERGQQRPTLASIRKMNRLQKNLAKVKQ